MQLFPRLYLTGQCLHEEERVRLWTVREKRKSELVISLIKQQSTTVWSVISDTKKVGGIGSVRR